MENKAKNYLRRMERRGELTPANVVRVAANPSNPLHELLTWDDDKAAHAHRMHEASNLIRVYRTEVTVKQRTFGLPDFTVVQRGSPRVATMEVPEEQRQAVFASQLNSAIGHLERAAKYQCAYGFGEELFDMVDQLRAMLEKLKRGAA